MAVHFGVTFHILIARHVETTAGSVTTYSGLTEGLLKESIELFVVWLIFELQGEDFLGELLHYGGVAAAEIV